MFCCHVYNLIHSTKFFLIPFTPFFNPHHGNQFLPSIKLLLHCLRRSTPPMATTAFCHFRSSPVLCSASRNSKPDPTRLQNQTQRVSSNSSTWWTPLFGWSSDPDYIQSSHTPSTLKNEISVQSEGRMGRPRSKFNLGSFTEEKAKELRRKTAETSTFHDIMYHSAIASRLASDVSGRREG